MLNQIISFCYRRNIEEEEEEEEEQQQQQQQHITSAYFPSLTIFVFYATI